MKNIYVTTPIYYINDKPHIGHAYTSIAADVVARFAKMNGANTKLTTGTDEHGQKVLAKAISKSMEPVEFADSISQHFVDLAQKIGIEYTDFIRTTQVRHAKTVSAFWQELEKNGYIYLGKYSGWYCQRDEAFYAQDELIDGRAPTGASVEWIEEESYFFRLSLFQDKLLEFYDQNPDFILPVSRRAEVISFVKSGLRDISVSRLGLKWGIPVPGDANHTIYVWLDALVNYLTSIGYKSPDDCDYKKFWQDADVIHVIGKDILKFHAIYWPAFLMAANLKLPTTILVHGWWKNEGEKISKSLGNTIDPIELLKSFSVDDLRYFLLKEIAFGKDGNFSIATFVQRINGDLANNMGNLVQRTLKLIEMHCGGKVPEYTNLDSIVQSAYKIPREFCLCMKNFNFTGALDVILSICDLANEYIDDKKPWSVMRDDKKCAMNILYNLAETIRCAAIMLLAFLPHSANKILDYLGVPQQERNLFKFISCQYKLKSGVQLPKPEPVFCRYH